MLADLKLTVPPTLRKGDGVLLMLLAVNLLLVAFFMMLNSISTYGAQHASDVLAKVREGYDLQGPLGEGKALTAPKAQWQQGVVQRVQGLMISRLLLNTPPLHGNAAYVDILLPLDAVFDAEGKVKRPAVLRNIIAAAGVESRLVWQLEGPWQDRKAFSAMLANLAQETGQAQMRGAREARLRVRVLPGVATKADTGLAIQQAGEAAGGTVQGLEGDGHGR